MHDDELPEAGHTHSRRDVIRTGLGAALFAALPMPVREAVRSARGAEPDLRYFNAALGAARWLRDTAITSPSGTSWAAVPPAARAVGQGMIQTKSAPAIGRKMRAVVSTAKSRG